ncbi:hypothetical protein ACFQX6_50970 [Streptosporangium lutulentum]
MTDRRTFMRGALGVGVAGAALAGASPARATPAPAAPVADPVVAFHGAHQAGVTTLSSETPRWWPSTCSPPTGES